MTDLLNRIADHFGYQPKITAVTMQITAQQLGMTVEDVYDLGLMAAQLGLTVDRFPDEFKGYMLASAGYIDEADVRAVRDMKIRWMRESR